MIQKVVYYAPLLALTLAVASCGGGSAEIKDPATIEGMEQRVELMEDSLKKGLIDPAKDKYADVRYADACLAVYRAFPKSKQAPRYLDKAHMIYSSAGAHGIAVLYADTLIQRYPSYDNRPMVLLSLASAYDLFIIPRKKDLVKKYYELLLLENPNLPKEEKEGYEFRLKNIDLTYDELIDLQTQKPVNQ